MSAIKDVLRTVIRKKNQREKLSYDIKKYAQYYSDSAESYGAKSYYEREILVLSHTIEKGLCHKNFKPKFGKASVIQLSECISAYLKFDEVNDYIVSLGVSALNEYVRAHTMANIDISDYNLNIPELSNTAAEAGVTNTTVSDFFSKTRSDFLSFSLSRHSMRLYDNPGEEIERDTLNRCVKIALSAPSACNRQAVRVLIIDNKETIKKVVDIQRGSNGFGENSSALILVFSDVRYYVTAERRLPMFDSGLFSMNLLYALHYEGLGSCILNGSFTEEQESVLKKIIDIPDYEMLAAVISVSKITTDADIRVAKSVRRSVDDIIKYY